MEMELREARSMLQRCFTVSPPQMRSRRRCGCSYCNVNVNVKCGAEEQRSKALGVSGCAVAARLRVAITVKAVRPELGQPQG
eukprot:NODE_16101_length_1012_cov_4.604520.p5 GENE.NODE_16101_length_1012_cov_4.604520~~NODE_16101_length_1012_cov_4.604520.p5  ORF type:complete len:82 (-),score=10.82 NODE_16101_length_1012_cov_4.604520:27-272(-)